MSNANLKLPLIYQSMQAVMREIGHVGKDQQNVQQNFKFRGVDDVMNALHAPMAKHGVFVTSQILDERRTERVGKNGGALFCTALRVSYTFHALDGSKVETMSIGEAMDSGDKSTSKAMSIAFKYAILHIFSIPTEDQYEPDNRSHEVEPESKARIEPVIRPAPRLERKADAQALTIDDVAPHRPDDARQKAGDFVIESANKELNGRKLRDVNTPDLKLLVNQLMLRYQSKTKFMPPREASFVAHAQLWLGLKE